MSGYFDDARRAVKRGTRSAGHALDVVHDSGREAIGRASHVADDVIVHGDRVARSATRYTRNAHDWMEEQPHLAALAALAVGALLGALLRPRGRHR